jgi:PIN domain nuclease of toxin-antitoxin system
VKLLLDTHVVLWWRGDDRRLSRAGRRAIATAGTVLVSSVSAWEVSIKSALGKLRLPGPFEAGVDDSGFTQLPITFAHAAAVATLPPHHTDPFDRMLLAQAIVEGCTLLTADRQFEPYRVPVLWM